MSSRDIIKSVLEICGANEINSKTIKLTLSRYRFFSIYFSPEDCFKTHIMALRDAFSRSEHALLSKNIMENNATVS